MPTEEKKTEKLTLLQLLIQSKANISIKNNTIYLYDIRSDGTEEFSKLLKKNEAPETRFKNILPYISSLVQIKNRKEEREPLPADLINQLTQAELEQIALKYITIPSISILSKKKENEDDEIITQKENEPVIHYLDRLLIEKDKRSHSAANRLKKLIEDSDRLGASIDLYKSSVTSSLLSSLGKNNDASTAFRDFDKTLGAQANKANDLGASSILGSIGKDLAASTASEFEKLLSASADIYKNSNVSPVLGSLEKNNDISEISKNFKETSAKWEKKRIAESEEAFRSMQASIESRKREREEELNRHQLMSEMTERSASLLKDLSSTAGLFLLEFEKRSKKTDIDTRKQIQVALIGIAFTTIFSLGSLYFTARGYYQIEENNRQNKSQELSELQRIETARSLKLQEEIVDQKVKLDEKPIIRPRKKPQ